MKYLSVLALMALAIIGYSCKKSSNLPDGNYNSSLEINRIVLNGVDYYAEIKGRLYRDYILETDTGRAIEKYVDDFEFYGNGTNQKFSFNTPPNAEACLVKVEMIISDPYIASSGSLGSIKYIVNGKTIIGPENITLLNPGTSLLSSPLYTAEFK